MISRELTGMAYEPVPEDVKKFVEERKIVAKQPQAQNSEVTEPEYDFIPEEATMTSQPQDPLQTAALKTVDFEARKDKLGNPEVYRLPKGDMGGNFEVAGINDPSQLESARSVMLSRAGGAV